MTIEAFFKISYGLYIVSSKENDAASGFVSNTVFQVSAEPPKLCLACSKNNHTTQLIERTGLIGVSVLAQHVRPDIIGAFGYRSGRDIDKFLGRNHIVTPSGIPILLDDAVAWFECKVEQTVDVGTHLVFIASVLDNALLDNESVPLTYAWYREVKKGKAPKNAPTFVDPEKLKNEMLAQQPQRFVCNACGHIYEVAMGDPEHGIPPGTPFDKLPADWHCPVCDAEKSDFSRIIK